MKNLIGSLMLALLVATGLFLVYQEASARPIACDYAETVCVGNCRGTFTLGDCWPYQGGMFCDFVCNNFILPGSGCEWSDPTFGMCKLY